MRTTAQRAVDVPRLIVDGTPKTVDSIKPSAHSNSEVFVSGYASRHLLPDWFLPAPTAPAGTIRTGGHTFRWEHAK